MTGEKSLREQYLADQQQQPPSNLLAIHTYLRPHSSILSQDYCHISTRKKPLSRKSNLENEEDFNFGLLNRSKRDTQPSQQTDDEDKIRKNIEVIDEQIAQTESTKEKLEQMLKEHEQNPQKDERAIENYKYGIERLNKRLEMLMEEKKRVEKQLSESKAAQSASTQPSPVPNDTKNETTQTKPVVTTTPLTPSGDSCLLVRLFQQKILFLQNVLQSIQTKVTMDLNFLRRMFNVK
ncbi:hypothetical protein RUM43_003991 [Polyplax serrata]|uniref:Uncharacterized protein n=1 Tax=Polyplax serrata TaxID=468196 RepID=A0AAN8XKS5_POLSC